MNRPSLRPSGASLGGDAAGVSGRVLPVARPGWLGVVRPVPADAHLDDWVKLGLWQAFLWHALWH